MTKSMETRKPLYVVLLLLLFAALSLMVLLMPGGRLRVLIEKRRYPREYREYVTKYAELYEVPEALVYAVIRTESRFQADAVSPAGAVGLMQLMPATFRDISDNILDEFLDDGMIRDPETNIRYGVCYLRWLYRTLGNWTNSIAAYNAGIGNVRKWEKTDGLADADGELIVREIPYDETRQYVTSVLRARNAYQRLYYPAQ